jgi:putative oxidoreductase
MGPASELHGIGVIAARVLLAAVFLYSGQDKLRYRRTSVAEVVELGVPYPVLFAAATIAAQLVGGLSVALDIYPAIGAALLAGFTIAATLLGHRFWLLHGARQELTTSLEHVARHCHIKFGADGVRTIGMTLGGSCCPPGTSILLPAIKCLGADHAIVGCRKSVPMWTKMAIDE